MSADISNPQSTEQVYKSKNCDKIGYIIPNDYAFLVLIDEDETEELKIELEEIELQYQKVVKDTSMKKHEVVMPAKKILSLKKTVPCLEVLPIYAQPIFEKNALQRHYVLERNDHGKLSNDISTHKDEVDNNKEVNMKRKSIDNEFGINKRPRKYCYVENIQIPVGNLDWVEWAIPMRILYGREGNTAPALPSMIGMKLSRPQPHRASWQGILAPSK
ncbi:hypothetical protein Syun_029331 [Stephania yunnanensis]|uniref:Uncharacterized protein n=1 Tax=Stephania yunnanensis TaxID=152371 RepID=A0AAP0HJC7_9MAGN